MHLQNLFSSLNIRRAYSHLPVHRHAAVKTSGTQQGWIQRFGTVGGGQNNHTVISLKSVHFRQQLVQRLFSFVVSSDLSVPFLTNRINLVNEHDTGRFLLGLLKQVTNLGRTHTDKHLYEFGTGDGEKRDVRFSGNRLGQHRFTCSGRAHQKNPFRHGCADLLIFLRIVQIVHDFRQVLLRLILTCHVAEADS